MVCDGADVVGGGGGGIVGYPFRRHPFKVSVIGTSHASVDLLLGSFTVLLLNFFCYQSFETFFCNETIFLYCFLNYFIVFKFGKNSKIKCCVYIVDLLWSFDIINS